QLYQGYRRDFVAKLPFDRGDVGLCRLLAHRGPRRIDRVVEVALAVVFTNEDLDLIRSACGDGCRLSVRYDRGRPPRSAGPQLLQKRTALILHIRPRCADAGGPGLELIAVGLELSSPAVGLGLRFQRFGRITLRWLFRWRARRVAVGLRGPATVQKFLHLPREFADNFGHFFRLDLQGVDVVIGEPERVERGPFRLREEAVGPGGGHDAPAPAVYFSANARNASRSRGTASRPMPTSKSACRVASSSGTGRKSAL